MSRTGKPSQHSELIVHLTRAIDQEQFETIKTAVKTKEYGGFLAGELEKLSSIQKLLEKMEHKGVFRVTSHPKKIVDYRKLKKVIRICENIDAVFEIESAERKLAGEGRLQKLQHWYQGVIPKQTIEKKHISLGLNNEKLTRVGFEPATSGLICWHS